MFKDQNMIFLSARALISMFFLASYSGPERSLMLALTLAYVSFAVFVYIYPGRLRRIKPYADTIFLIPMVALSNLREAVFALLMPVLFYSNKRFLPTSVAFLTLCFFLIRAEGAVYLPLALGLLIASLQPQLIGFALRDRRYFMSLRRAYRDLVAEHEELRSELEFSKLNEWLLEQALTHPSLDEYLKAVAKRLSLKGILLTQEEVRPQEHMIKLSVKLPKGHINVVFFFDSELQMRDRELLELCRRAAKYLSLYLEDPKDFRLVV
ncbi:MAG: hypothetical protein NZL90_02750 [Aquificaceae bacterium]|nr:hypothetical protein [Aquificaceae bacterium]